MSKPKDENKKEKGRKSSVIMLLLMIVCLGVFGFSAYKIISQKAEDNSGEAVYEEIEQAAGMDESRETRVMNVEKKGDNVHLAEEEINVAVVDFEALRKQNSEIFAWIEIPDTIVNYPVVQAPNNDKYLRHLLDGSYHRFGTLFFDYRHNLDNDVLNDDMTYIYGHNIRAGNMFHIVQFYKDQSYYDEHPFGILHMPNETYRLDFFAMNTVQDTDELLFFYPEDHEEFLLQMKQRSHFKSPVEVSFEDQLVGLFTCTNEDESERYILYAKAVPLVMAEHQVQTSEPVEEPSAEQTEESKN